MRVIVVHKIFIGCSIAAAAVLALSRYARWQKTGDSSALTFALLAAVAIPVMALYLRRIWRK